jgi:hypothetical protein
MLKGKLLSGEKRQTIRTTFIPNFFEGEIIKIKFNKKEIFRAKVTEIYPKQLFQITEKEAKLDGFDSREECFKGLFELNNLSSLKHYCFIIRFEKILNLDKYIEKQKIEA